MHDTAQPRTTTSDGDRPADTAARNVRAVGRFLDLLSAHDLAAVGDMFAADAEVSAPFAPEGMPSAASGQATITAVFTQVFSGYGRAEFRDRRIAATTDAGVVAARWVADIDVLASGRRYLSEVVAFFEFRHGRIEHYTEYFNPDRLRAAAGLP